MEKKTIIWHYGDTPEPNRPYLHYKSSRDNGANGWYVGMYRGSNKGRLGGLREGKYAYIDEILATSKALDVAIKALTNLAEPDGQIMRGYNLIADGAIKDIEEIIGGK